MKPEFTIQEQTNPSAEDLAYVSRQFREYNDKKSGVFPSKSLNLFVYADDKKIIAALIGNISWGWLHVDTLWVSDPFREQGLGTILMDKAEEEALKMNVRNAYLETTDFQALEFYQKRGYQIFAKLEDQPPGHICYYLKNTELGNT